MIRARFPILMLVAILAMATLARADEYDTLRTRWRDMLTQGTNSSFANSLYSPWISSLDSSASSYLSSMKTGPGRTNLWNTYPNPGSDSSDISGTYGRLRTMALAFSVRGSDYLDNSSMRNAAIDGLDWMYANYYNPTGVVYDNWFDFEIATPLALNDIVVLLYSNLSPAQINNYMSAVEHFTPSPAYSSISTNVTGANKVWKALAVSLRGVIVQDPAKIILGSSALSDVFGNVTSGDGFYADGSFVFHNFFPYNGGYGVDLLDTMGSMMQLLQGSTWQVTDPAQANIYKWVYDSYEPFIFKGGLMQMVDGRYHTRTGDDHAEGHDLIAAILRVAQFAPPADAAAFKSFVKGAIQSDTYRNFVSKELPPYNVWANAVLNDSNVIPLAETAGHRQFPSMDRIVHRTANWAFGLAMSSYRVGSYESTRGENLRGWFTADGMTYLYNSDLGHYADNFWSTVDPYRMPGTTIDAFPRANASGDGYRSPTNNQVGGASIQGLYGVAAMQLNAYDSTLSARKSWFMFDNEIVCLGNSVRSTNGRVAETIIENRRLGLYGNNAFTVNGASKPSSPGWAEAMSATSWAHLAGTTVGADIGYYFPQTATINALRESRSGAFKDINTTYGSSTRNTRHYLTMYVDHGINPGGSNYSYVLLPGMAASAVASYAATPDITVLQNNSIATAVRENKLGITAINYWQDTSNQISGAGANFDRKAAAIWRYDGTVLDLGVSEPTQTNTTGINVEINTPVSITVSVDPGVSVLQTSPTLKLFFNTSNTFGATLRAKFSVVPVQTNILSPVADAYVQNGPESDTNFGSNSLLRVKLAGTTLTREAYLRFDLSSITGTILDANLRLVPSAIQEPITNAIALVTNNSWIETGDDGINWSNKPPSGTEFFQWKVESPFSNVLVPVTSLAQQAISADGKLSFRVYSTSVGTNGGLTTYGAKDGTSSNRPQMIVMFSRTPPTVALSSPSECNMDAPGTVMLMAEAQDADGTIARVDFYNGATRVAQSFAPPHHVTVPNLAAGTFDFRAVAVDNSSLMATSGAVSISVYSPRPMGQGTGLVGEYFKDQGEFRVFSFARTDANVDFYWPSGNYPIANADHFSVRWMGKLQARHSGLHQIHTYTDEGVRLWIDGRLVIDNWNTHPNYAVDDFGSFSLIAGRYYNITVEFFEKAYSAVARLYWTQPGSAEEIIPQSQLYPADQGLRATYFSGTNLATSSAVLTRIDDAVNFSWGTNSPDPAALGVPFAARWMGKVRANQSGTYSFVTVSDDAVRLWVNGQIIISNWTAHALTTNSNTITLTGGQYYDLMMEYFNAAGVGSAVLMWQPPNESMQVIPTANLTPHQNNNPPSLSTILDLSAARNGAVSFTASATDQDAPPNSLSFSLDAGAPNGASINSSNGLFTWTPSNDQPFGPVSFTVRVTDNGSPQMTDAQTVTITVLTNPTLSFVRSGNSTVLTWPQSAGPLQLQSSTNLSPPVIWMPVTNTAVISNGEWSVQLPAPTNAAQFFRLQTP